MDTPILDEMDRIGEVLAEAPAAKPIDHGHFVVAEPIAVALAEKSIRVVDQELPDVLVPVREYLAAGPALGGKIKASVVVARRLSVVIIEALVVKRTPGVVVDNVEKDGDPVQVEKVNHCLHLADLRGEPPGPSTEPSPWPSRAG